VVRAVANSEFVVLLLANTTLGKDIGLPVCYD